MEIHFSGSVEILSKWYILTQLRSVQNKQLPERRLIYPYYVKSRLLNIKITLSNPDL